MFDEYRDLRTIAIIFFVVLLPGIGIGERFSWEPAPDTCLDDYAATADATK